MVEITRRQMLKTGGALAVMPSIISSTAAGLIPAANAGEMDSLPRVKQDLVAPPFVPDWPQVAEGGPKIIEIQLVVKESKKIIDDIGTEINSLAFNGTIPGPLVICHQDDYVELTLINPKGNIFEHNIDFHASTGALGGGGLTHVKPGEQVKLRWKATKPGTYIYHCAPGGIMIPYHVVSGMNGAVMVLPREGLNDGNGNSLSYDRAYYIGEQDFYVPRDENGNFKTYATNPEALADTLAVMNTLLPSHVVLNGKVGALAYSGEHEQRFW